MMSKKQWFFVLCIFIIYLLLGASIFYRIESREERIRNEEDIKEKLILQNLIRKHFVGTEEDEKSFFHRLSNYCGKPLGRNMTEEPEIYRWDFYHSLFFVITVVSTIGYGNLAPTTMFTRIFMIFYGLIGIPMNGIVMVTLGEFFAKSFTKLHQRWKKTNIDYYLAKIGLYGQIILYLIPGLTFFIFLPSTIIMVFEGWPYDVCVYYSFVTLTTIGFGDYVAGVNDEYNLGELYGAYKIFLLVWIIGGLGYVVMIITFITRGLQSKKIVKLERIISDNLKQTPKKIRHELRAMLQELLFLRVKRVYKDEFEYIPQFLVRSQSAPDLTLYKKDSPSTIRKRAMSECFRETPFMKVSSDTDLERIDKEKTFRPADALMKQTDLLLKVVDALNINAYEKNCFHGPSDSEILDTENFTPNNRKQRRAISDIRPPSSLYDKETINGNTWYGEDATHAITEYKHRQRTMSIPAFTKAPRPSFFQRIRNRLVSRDENIIDIEKQNYLDDLPILKTNTYPDTNRRISGLSTHQEQVLEQTSIAELIRALSVVTAPENIQADLKERRISANINNSNLSPRTRRSGITALTQSRRNSLISETVMPPINDLRQRRLSLRPSEEMFSERKTRKISSKCLMPPRKSFTRPDFYQNTAIPPTVPELRHHEHRENSPEGPAPPPYSAVPLRRFSVRPTNLAQLNLNSPVQRQVIKRERTDTESSNTSN